jgi:multicomponent Na+:H+ antiporter subunit D
VSDLAPLVVAGPFLVAAIFAASLPISRRRDDIVAIVTSAGGVIFVGALFIDVVGQDWPVVTFLGDWQPRHGISLGIAMAYDPMSAGLALLAAVLVCAALLFAWRYFETSGPIFHAMVLVFGGAMAGFCLSGDLFNLFVFFELMSVAAYALTAYRVEERGPLQGALTFAVSNTIGAVFILFGIALLYARTGALNLAQIGEALSHGSADGLVVTAFACLAIGFMVKASVVPFHFWLADAYTVAPTPACVIFSGVMSDLGIYALARIYWATFSGPLGPHAEGVTIVLVALGALTAVWGAVLCLAQHHLKRMLAFVTTSQIGLALIGVGLLTPEGIAAAALLVLADGLLRSGLFVSVGAVIHRCGSANELRLQRSARLLPRPLGAIFFAGVAGMLGAPFLGAFGGKRLLDHAAIDDGRGWLLAFVLVATVLTGAALLRAGGRVFLGWGPSREHEREALGSRTEDEVEEDERELAGAAGYTPPVMIATAAVLVAAGLAVGLVPSLVDRVLDVAARFTDRAAYAAAVLHNAVGPEPHAPPVPIDAEAVVVAVVSVLAAVGIALAYLSPRRVSLAIPAAVRRPTERSVLVIRRLHSGQAGDYVAWLTVGAAGFGVLMAIASR